MKKIKLTLLRKIDLIFLFATAVLAVLFFITFKSLQFSKDSSNQVSHAQEVLYHLERINSNIVDIETAHRGFVISGNEDYLSQIDDAKQETNEGLLNLNKLLSNRSHRVAQLDSLAFLIQEKINISELGISLRRKDATQALLFVSSGKGRVIMSNIRSITKNLEAEELKILNERVNLNKSSLTENYRNYLIFAVFALILVLVFHLKIRGNASKLIKYQYKQAELIKELNYQNKQLDDFAHITSHNIRSPANNISTLISLLDDRSTIEDYRNVYGMLSKVSNNLNETLTELIEVLHVKKEVSIEKHKLHFDEVYQKVKESLQGEIIKHKVIVTADFSEAPMIKYPKTYLESIFHNLISNSIKYKSPQRTPEIHVSSHFREGKLQLIVTDNGLGIDLKRHGSKIFGLRKVFHEHAQAKGIGLFMTRAQIETLGGTIGLESEVNKGTTFKVIFNDDNIVKDIFLMQQNTNHLVEELV